MDNNNTVIKALVVDDNEVNTLVLKNMLDLFGIQVDQTFNGKNAVKLAKKSDYAIIFLDHIMPDMNGVKTTEAIRSISKDKQNSIIIALTANVTEDICALYHKAGANSVISKPLSLPKLVAVLQQWCPYIPIPMETLIEETPITYSEDEYIKNIIEEIPEINYNIGIKYAIGSPAHFIHILEASLKDIKSCINQIMRSLQNETTEELKKGIHSLLSVFANIGAVELLDEAKDMEAMITQFEIGSYHIKLTLFINHIQNFRDNLTYALDQYEKTKLILVKEETIHRMSQEECEQSISNTIYYIKRYEYDAILIELDKLIQEGPKEYKQELIKAKNEIEEFNYNSALSIMMKIKK